MTIGKRNLASNHCCNCCDWLDNFHRRVHERISDNTAIRKISECYREINRTDKEVDRGSDKVTGK